jgi:hypothetical protein
MKKSLFFIIITILIFFIPTNSLLADENDDTYLLKLKLSQRSIQEKRYSKALLYLREVVNDLQTKQKNIIKTFFPKIIADFSFEESAIYQMSSFEEQTTGSGVLISRHYISNNEERGSIDLLVVFSDPAIAEYINIINNPHLLKNLEEETLQTKIIKIKDKYNAIEKSAADENYYERNIVVNENTLLNLIGQDIPSKNILDSFCDDIDIKGLDHFLGN